jgi:hypothetical protein
MPAVRRPGKSFPPRSAPPRAAANARPGQSDRQPDRPARADRPGAAPAAAPASAPAAAAPSKKSGDEHPILFQKFFKSTNPQRTYAAQIKRSTNGNHYLVLTEGRRDESNGEVRKTRLFIFSEDFKDFFAMLQATAVFIRENPVPEEIKQKRQRFWAKKNAETGGQSHAAPRPTPQAPQAAAQRPNGKPYPSAPPRPAARNAPKGRDR